MTLRKKLLLTVAGIIILATHELTYQEELSDGTDATYYAVKSGN